MTSPPVQCFKQVLLYFFFSELCEIFTAVNHDDVLMLQIGFRVSYLYTVFVWLFIFLIIKKKNKIFTHIC